MKQPEEILFDNYIAEVKEQLVCNAPKDYKYRTFHFYNHQIDANLDYFERCLDKRISSTQAIEEFEDYLDLEIDYNWRNHKKIINDLINKSK